MEKIIYSGEKFDKNKFNVEEVCSTPYFSIQRLQLLKDNLLSVDINKGDDGSRSEINIYVIEGNIEIAYANEKIVLSKSDSVTLRFLESYSIRASERSEILFLSLIPVEHKSDYNSLINTIIDINKKDLYTMLHSYRVSLYSSYIANALGLPSGDLGLASQFHDVGKIDIPTEILTKEAKLSKEEFDEIKNHPVYSYNILKKEYGEGVANLARHHHERLDGSGYPDGLKSDQLTIYDRILAVADVFDAITSNRPYHKGKTFINGIKLIREQEQGRLDMSIVDVLDSLIKNNVVNEVEIHQAEEEQAKRLFPHNA